MSLTMLLRAYNFWFL